jgi:palmitoyltransferase
MELEKLAVPSVYILITFLSYSCQYLFLYLEPGPLTPTELIYANTIIICILICYTRTVFVSPGQIPKEVLQELESRSTKQPQKPSQPRKWCRKCNAPKPARAHHCRACGRCIPKMDHHCPWTANCVSQTTFPHFIRFLAWAVTGMAYLESLLWPRIQYIWNTRHMPSYHGPSVFQLGHLFVLFAATSLTLFVLGILLAKTLYSLAVNTTTIETWEIERHAKLVRRSKAYGGYLEGPDGIQMRIVHVEFPFDIGFWANFKQGMGTGNVLVWLFPFAKTPVLMKETLTYPVNDFSDRDVVWPPPDPDRLQRKGPRGVDREGEAFTYRDIGLTPDETVAAFRMRQELDDVRRRKPFVQRAEAELAKEKRALNDEDYDNDDGGSEEDDQVVNGNGKESVEGSQSGEEGWRNSEGERLRDFGLDEAVEFYDEEDELPLSELLARKKARASTADSKF